LHISEGEYYLQSVNYTPKSHSIEGYLPMAIDEPAVMSISEESEDVPVAKFAMTRAAPTLGTIITITLRY
jgi:hypothetical protein